MASCTDIEIKFKKDIATGDIVLDDIVYGEEPTTCEIKDDEVLMKNDVVTYDDAKLKKVIEKVKTKKVTTPANPAQILAADNNETPVETQEVDNKETQEVDNKETSEADNLNRIENPELDAEADAQAIIDEASDKKIKEAQEAMDKQEAKNDSQVLEQDEKEKKLGGKRKTCRGGKKIKNVSKKVRFNMTKKRGGKKRRGTRK